MFSLGGVEYEVISLMITNKSGFRILQEIEEQEGEEKIFIQISKAVSIFNIYLVCKFKFRLRFLASRRYFSSFSACFL